MVNCFFESLFCCGIRKGYRGVSIVFFLYFVLVDLVDKSRFWNILIVEGDMGFNSFEILLIYINFK